MTGERLAHLSGGVFILRIEDTDSKREVEGATENLINTLAHYGVVFDEGATVDGDNGDYGPYRQSERKDIYHVFAKQLVMQGQAYPCFSTDEELMELQAQNKKEEIQNRDWQSETEEYRQQILKLREFSLSEVEENLRMGNKFVLRIKADGDISNKIPFTDLIKGKLDVPENDEDFVLLKSDGIPTYHFAHAVDDRLMGTTHVIRGEEWLPSLPKHIMLFKYLGFKMPKYMHIAQIMKMEGGSKKKLSKRDKGADMNDYKRMGYSADSVIEYVMTLLNSNYEEWHAQNSDMSYKDFPFSIKKMNTSGCLFDFDKLNDVAKNVLSKYTAQQVYDGVISWAVEYDPDFERVLKKDREYAESIFAIGRAGKKPRKDFATWGEVKGYMGFFYDEYFEITDCIPEEFQREDIYSVLSGFAAAYDDKDDQSTWFDKIKALAENVGYASDMKAYKAEPEKYKGNVADASSFLRIAVTGRQNSPDMYEVMKVLGKDKVIARVLALAKLYK